MAIKVVVPVLVTAVATVEPVAEATRAAVAVDKMWPGVLELLQRRNSSKCV